MSEDDGKLERTDREREEREQALHIAAQVARLLEGTGPEIPGRVLSDLAAHWVVSFNPELQAQRLEHFITALRIAVHQKNESDREQAAAASKH